MNEKSFSFGTDIHGNLESVDRFLKESADRGVKHVIFGGDIAPKKMGVRFSDGMGVKFTTPSHMQDRAAVQNHVMPEATLHERGYMLFESGMTSVEQGQLLDIYDKFQQLDGNIGVSFSLEEIELIERRLKEKFIEYCTGNMGETLFKLTVRGQDWTKSIISSATPEIFFQHLITVFKFDYLVREKKIPKDRKAMGEVLLGRPSMTQQEVDDAFNIWYTMGNANYKKLLDNFSTYTHPRFEWDQVLRNLHHHSVKGQTDFAHDLLRRIHQFRDQNRASVTLILGNDDAEELVTIFDDAEKSGLIHHPHGRVAQLDEETQIFGYSYVPPMPFEHDRWYKPEEEIEKDLGEISKQLRTDVRFCIANIHCPPSETSLSKGVVPGVEQTDWGSKGVRKYIEQEQPHLVLSGHIHESWQVTGQVKDQIGETVILNPGASEYRPRFITGNIENPNSYEIIA